MHKYKYQDAVLAFRSGGLAKCRKICDYLIMVNADNADAKYLLAQVEVNQNNHGKAVSLLNDAIEINPEIANYHFALGKVYLHINLLSEALDQLRITVSIDSKNAEVWSFICSTAGQLGFLNEAIKAGETAVRIQPEFLGAQMNLATAYDTYGLGKLALKHYKNALRIAPNHPVVLCKVGDALVSTGDKNSAEKHYRKAILKQPNYTHPYRQISRLTNYTSSSHEDFSTIKRLLESGYIPESSRNNLHFALGKMYEDCKLFDSSFKHYEIANRIENTKHNFNRRRFSEFITNIISTYTCNFIQEKSRLGDPNEQPVFIIGMPRSGSTMLEQIIARHPKAHGAGELYWFGQIESRVQETLSSTEMYPNCVHDIDKDSLRALASDYLEYLGVLTENKSYKKITDKLLGNFLHAGLISIMFPNARIIHCRRNPLDTCFSIYSILFPGNLEFGYDLHNIGFVYNEYMRLMAHWDKTLQKRLITIDYEEIVKNNEEISKRIIEFIGLDWSEECLKISNSNAVSTVSAFQVRRDIYTSSIGRWKNYEKHLGPLIEVLEKI